MQKTFAKWIDLLGWQMFAMHPARYLRGVHKDSSKFSLLHRLLGEPCQNILQQTAVELSQCGNCQLPVLDMYACVTLSPCSIPPASALQAAQRFARIIMHTKLLDWQILSQQQAY